MKEMIKFLGFIVGLILIFWIENPFLLGITFLLSFIGFAIYKVDIRNFINHLKIVVPFVVFTMVLNGIFAGWKMGVLIGIRLVLAYHITYLFSKTMTSFQMANVIKKCMYPFKIFGINPEKIEMIIRIAFCVLPILKNEIEQKQYALKAKGLPFQLKDLPIILKPLFISILRRTKEMEKSLIAKAYEEG